MEFDVRTNEIGNGIGQRRVFARGVFPEHWVVVVHTGQSPQPRMFRGVSAIDIPSTVGLSDFAAAFNHFLGGGPQALDPTVGKEFLQQDEAIGEIKFALLFREDAGFNGQESVRAS